MQVGGVQTSSTTLAASSAKRSGFAYYDPKDINQDGVVSSVELLTYSLRHPELDTSKRTRPQEKPLQPLVEYSPREIQNSRAKAVFGAVDFYA